MISSALFLAYWSLKLTAGLEICDPSFRGIKLGGDLTMSDIALQPGNHMRVGLGAAWVRAPAA